MSRPIPDRIRWAVNLLRVEPHARVLEVGCGTGVAVEVIAAHLTTGTIVAIDRSARAVACTKRRNANDVRAGRVHVLHTTLARLHAHHAPFDVAFSVDVNVFWMATARAEIAALHQVLEPAGLLAVLYGPSPLWDQERSERQARIEGRLATIRQSLETGGFVVEAVLNEDQGSGVLARRNT